MKDVTTAMITTAPALQKGSPMPLSRFMRRNASTDHGGQHSLSRFMRRTLMPGEEVVREGYFHTFYTFAALCTLVFYIALGAGLQYAAERYLQFHTDMPVVIGLFIGLWMFFWMLLKKWTTEIVLTNERLIYKHGFFLIQSQEVDIEQLASDNVEQTFIGRLFDYGTLHIRCIEASDFRLPPIRAPYDFRNALEQQKHHYRDNYVKVERLRRHGGNDGKGR